MKYQLLFILCSFFVSYAQESKDRSAENLRNILKPYFVPIQKEDNYSELELRKIDVGRKLFYETKLSFNDSYSCNSCHDLKKYGTNGSYYLAQKEKGMFFRDVPSLYNSSKLTLFNSDGIYTSQEKRLHMLFVVLMK